MESTNYKTSNKAAVNFGPQINCFQDKAHFQSRLLADSDHSNRHPNLILPTAGVQNVVHATVKETSYMGGSPGDLNEEPVT